HITDIDCTCGSDDVGRDVARGRHRSIGIVAEHGIAVDSQHAIGRHAQGHAAEVDGVVGHPEVGPVVGAIAQAVHTVGHGDHVAFDVDAHVAEGGHDVANETAIRDDAHHATGFVAAYHQVATGTAIAVAAYGIEIGILWVEAVAQTVVHIGRVVAVAGDAHVHIVGAVSTS
ncbi:MAG: hypothetical protein ACK55I_38205, partial [bacterium]